jgi:hypothetical protein
VADPATSTEAIAPEPCKCGPIFRLRGRSPSQKAQRVLWWVSTCGHSSFSRRRRTAHTAPRPETLEERVRTCAQPCSPSGLRPNMEAP